MSTKTKDADVIMYHFGSHALAPSTSAFCLKLETYFRMAGIKYSLQTTSSGSSKGKLPYITHKGKTIADSSFIIEYLNEAYEVDLSSHLSPSDKGVALAFQRLCEENLYWVSVYQRWIVENGALLKRMPFVGMKKKLLPVLLAVKIKPTVRANLHGQGIGRHSKEEIYHICEKDLTAISSFLGEKEFLMGSKVSEADACVFGTVAQMVYASPDSEQEKFIKEKLPNLVAYCDRLKAQFWPDWDDCCYNEKQQEETSAKKTAENVTEASTEKDQKQDGAKPAEEKQAGGDAEATDDHEQQETAAEGGDHEQKELQGEETNVQQDASQN